MRLLRLVFFTALLFNLFRTDVSAATTFEACRTDLNSDLLVDTTDYGLLVQNFLLASYMPASDITKDGIVDLTDYAVFVSQFFNTCPTPYVPTLTSTSLQIEAEHYDPGKFFDKTTGNRVDSFSNIYRTDDVDIKAASQSGYIVGHLQNGEWLEYSLEIPESLAKVPLNVSLRYGSAADWRAVRVDVDGVLFAKIYPPKTGAYTTLKTITFAGKQLTAGSHTVRLTIEQEYLDIDWFALTTSPPDAVVALQPGDAIQTVVNQYPAGTTYVLRPGVYRQQRIIPKSGDTFIGEKGAVLSGSRLVTAAEMKQEGNLYFIDGQTQEAVAYPTNLAAGTSTYATGCQPGFERCNRQELLFIDDLMLEHVASKSAVVAGKWFFDYPADRIYFADSPIDKTVEVSSDGVAFTAPSTVQNVTIKNLVIEKYSTKAQGAPLNIRGTGPGWVIENNEIRLNGAVGMNFGKRATVRGNFVHHNGQLGIAGGGLNNDYDESGSYLVENNEISYNNLRKFDITWEGGGTKFAYTTNLVLRNNYSHHNEGPGIWTDIDNVNALYDGNIVVYNTKHGIEHEISMSATIQNNFCGYNGRQGGDGIQIFVQNSRDVVVKNNIAVLSPNQGQGIVVHNYNRGTAVRINGPRISTNTQIMANKIYASTYAGVLGGIYASSTAPFDYTTTASTLKYAGNTYYTPNNTAKMWNMQSLKTFSEFQAMGQEVGGVLAPAVPLPTPPAWTVLVGPR